MAETIRNSVAAVGRGLRTERVMPALVAGVITATVSIVFSVSYAALVFSGRLAEYLPAGIGLALFSATVLGAVIALTSSCPGIVGAPQGVPAVPLALMTATVAAGMAGAVPGEVLLATVVLTIALSSLLMGAVFMGLGCFKAGSLVRYIPYPVIGGFLAAIGWLMVCGSISVMTGEHLTMEGLDRLLRIDSLPKWLPGAGFGLLLWEVGRRYRHFAMIPGMIVAGICFFYGVVWAAGGSVAEARAAGWLLGPFPEGVLWRSIDFAALDRRSFLLLAGQAQEAVTLITICLIVVLLYAASLEIALRRNVDVNRELRAVGLANMLAGLGGGLPGYHSPSLSVMNHRIGADSRLVGLIAAGLCGLALFFGATIIGYFPRPVLGGVLVFLGLSFLVEWLWQGWSTLSRSDYAVVLLILGVSATIGFLEGVVAGIVAGIAIFVVSYSRTSIVKNTLTGARLHSNVDRAESQRGVLRDEGDQILILKLQGFIFFGTAYQLIGQILARLGDRTQHPLEYVALDFRLVSGLDSSVAVSFAKLVQHAEDRGFHLCVTGLRPDLFVLLRREGIAEERRYALPGAVPPSGDRRASDRGRTDARRPTGGRVRLFADLGHGLEWCENHLLLAAGRGTAPAEDGLEARLQRAFPPSVAVADFMRYVERCAFPGGDCLIRQGSESQDLFFIVAGQVSVELETERGQRVRLRAMGPGTAVGEVALYLGQRRSASVVATMDTTAYRLRKESLAAMAEQYPEVAAAFHAFMAGHLAERLVDGNRLIEALSD